MDNITKYKCKTEAFKSFFFPWTTTEWNSLDLQIRNLSYTALHTSLMNSEQFLILCLIFIMQ